MAQLYIRLGLSGDLPLSHPQSPDFPHRKHSQAHRPLAETSRHRGDLRPGKLPQRGFTVVGRTVHPRNTTVDTHSRRGRAEEGLSPPDPSCVEDILRSRWRAEGGRGGSTELPTPESWPGPGCSGLSPHQVPEGNPPMPMSALFTHLHQGGAKGLQSLTQSLPPQALMQWPLTFSSPVATLKTSSTTHPTARRAAPDECTSFQMVSLSTCAEEASQ